MKQLHSSQDAIEQAIKGGYHFFPIKIGNRTVLDIKNSTLSFDEAVKLDILLLDPLFWQALGEARGWGNPTIPTSWLIASSSWFKLRMEGGDENKFWQSLP